MMLIKDMEFCDLRGKYFDDIFEKIAQENVDQVDEWGIQDARLFEWAQWTTEEYGEFIKALNEYVYGRAGWQDIVKEGIQTITLLMKMLEIIMNQEESKVDK